MTKDIAKTNLRQVQTVKQLLINDQAREQLQAVAAKHMRPERMMRLMANAIRVNPTLAECEPLTLLGAMMTSASLGLEPNTPLGHAYLIPFKNRRKGITEVTFIIGYKGMISLARRSGAIVNIHADVVYEGDEFSFEYGSNQHLRHIPKGSRKNPVSAYCHAKLTDGEAFIVLPWEVILETRDASQGYKTAIKYGKKDTPWIAHLHAMAKKTAVRRLFDELPISIEEVNDAMGIDDEPTDFQGFAIDATAGMPETGEVIDGEADEVEAEEKPKPKPKPRAKAKPKAEPEPDPEPDHDPETGEITEESGGDEDDEETRIQKEQLTNLANAISADIEDGATKEDIDSLYGPQLEQMAVLVPDVFKRLQSEMEGQ